MSETPQRPLYQHWPQLADRYPLIELGMLPTPVDQASDLANDLQLLTLDIKRDDLSAADYGGNKIRKLEFLFGDALAAGKSAVLTYGGLGSNHARATALKCRQLGLQCTVILTHEPMTAAVQQTLDHHAELGTRVEIAERYADVQSIAAQVIADVGAQHCYEIPFGGSSWVGSLGFVNAALELATQVDAGECAAPDVIYVACGTAGTVAGLAIGLELAGLPTRIEALQVTPDSMQPMRLTTRLVTEMTDDLADAGVPVPTVKAAIGRVRIRNEQLGDGYADPTPAGREAVDVWSAATGLPMSLTYTAKAFAGLLADARSGTLAGQRVMFWNTYNSRAL